MSNSQPAPVSGQCLPTAPAAVAATVAEASDMVGAGAVVVGTHSIHPPHTTGGMDQVSHTTRAVPRSGPYTGSPLYRQEAADWPVHLYAPTKASGHISAVWPPPCPCSCMGWPSWPSACLLVPLMLFMLLPPTLLWMRTEVLYCSSIACSVPY